MKTFGWLLPNFLALVVAVLTFGSPPHGQVLPRDAVEAATWCKILTLVGQRAVP